MLYANVPHVLQASLFVGQMMANTHSFSWSMSYS